MTLDTALHALASGDLTPHARAAIAATLTGAHAEAHIDELSHRYDGHGYSYTPGQVREILKIRPKRIIRYKD